MKTSFILNSPKLTSALLCGFVLLAVGCSTSRYSMQHDAGPVGEFDARFVPEAVPIWEPLSRMGNKSPYVVRGKQYQVMDRIEGYSEKGVASWYGLKFHGALTSNGEVYNMYEMTAAHKSLPLPSFVRVTNLDNNLSVVVRVNDRGPFHGERIIDLSYAAAKKLGYDKKGTANVKLDVITVRRGAGRELIEKPDRLATFVQLGAFSSEKSAQALKLRASKIDGHYEAFVAKVLTNKKALYRVRVGPISKYKEAEALLEKLRNNGLGSPSIITRAISAKDR